MYIQERIKSSEIFKKIVQTKLKVPIYLPYLQAALIYYQCALYLANLEKGI